MKVELIVSHYDAGHYQHGWGLGSKAIIDGELAERLTNAGHDVVVSDISRVDGVQGREVATGFAVCAAIAERVRSAIANERFPVVIAGNCMTAVGAVSGENADGIAWVDQHGDLHSPETSASGLLDGMALSTVLGQSWRAITREVVGLTPIDPALCLLVDARDLDVAEVDAVRDLSIRQASWQDAPKAFATLGDASRVHLHLDMDAHNPAAFQANAYAAPGGPTPEQLCNIASLIAASLPVAGVTLTAYDPTLDPEGKGPGIAAALILHVLNAIQGAKP